MNIDSIVGKTFILPTLLVVFLAAVHIQLQIRSSMKSTQIGAEW